MKELLKVVNLGVHFETSEGVVKANRGIDLEVGTNDVLGIMGESGCGKTVLFLSLLRLQQPGRIVSGSVFFEGRDLLRLKEKEMQRIRGNEIALVPQDHTTSLNPAFNIGTQLREVIAIRQWGGGLWQTTWGTRQLDRAQARKEIDLVLQDLGLGERVRGEKLLRRYPHQLSGGIRQRILIAMALLAHPKMLIADEPTTALDRATQAQALDLLESMRGRLTMLIISHDVEVVARVCDRVAVMYAGKIIERGETQRVLSNPRHPYTKLLLSSQKLERGEPVPSALLRVQDLIDLPSGCSFHPSCPEAMPLCSQREPEEVESDGIKAACHRFAGRTGS